MKGEFEKAIGVFTEAIKINSNSAAMFAKRGMCYLKISPKATNACVKVNKINLQCSGVTPILDMQDCSRAIELNPDNAAAYKWRGRAFM